MHKAFLFFLLSRSWQDTVGCFFVCLFFQLVHLVSAAEIIREKEAELSGFLPGSAGWPDSTQGKGLLTDGRV